MAAIDFPASPTTGQLFSAANGVTYMYNGTIWIVQAGPGGGTGDFCSYLVGPTALPTTASVATTMPVVSGNAGGWYTPGNGQYKPPAGRYQLFASMAGIPASGLTNIQIALMKNGALLQNGVDSSNTSTWGSCVCGITADANGSDIFTFMISASSAGTNGYYLTFGAYSLTGMQGPMGPPFAGGTGDFTAANSANVTLATSFATVLFSAIASGNSGSWYNPATGRYTPPAGKYYLYTSFVAANAAAASNFSAVLRKNGTSLLGSSVTTSAAGFVDTVECSVNVDANGTDFFDVVAQGTATTTATTAVFGGFPLTGLTGPTGPTGPVGSVPVIRIQKFTASGTYTPHANMQSGYVVGIGGGGAGGGYTGNAGGWQGSGGGGSGSKVTTFLTRAQVVPNVAVTIGAGGVGVVNANGGNGGSTIFGSLLTANGGNGGGQYSGGAWAGGGVGDIIEGGFPGGSSMQMTATGIAGTAVGGQGGGAWGGLGIPLGSSAGAGNPGATNSGSGGAGSASANYAGPLGAANGGSGYLYVVEYCSS